MTHRYAIGLMVVFLAVMLLAGCTRTQPPSAPPSPPANVTPPQPNVTPPSPPLQTALQKGVSLSPRSFGQEDFTNFFVEARQAGNIVMWAGDWNELGTDGAPKTVAELASVYNYVPVIEATYYSQGEGRLLRPLDDATKRAIQKQRGRLR